MGKYKVLGTLLDRVFRNDLNKNFEDIDTDITTQKVELTTRIDNIIQNNPQPSEVVDLRMDSDGVVHPTAKERADSDYQKVNVKLAENVQVLGNNMTSPDGTKWKLTVDNYGNLSVIKREV